jgi:hypothetical protein
MIRLLSRLFPADPRLLVQAVVLLVVFRLTLRICPTQTLRRFLDRRPRPGPASEDLADQVAWAVTEASRHIGATTCLTRALATLTLMDRRRCCAALQIGVAADPQGRFEAHAWVVSSGRVVMGKIEDLSRFTPLRPVAWESQDLPEAT